MFQFLLLGLLAGVGAWGTEYFENYYNEIDVDDELAEVKTRNAMSSPRQLWPSTRIYYRIASDCSPEEVANVHTALATFNEQSCLQFEELTGPAPPGSRYVYYKKSDRLCGTRIGYNPLPVFGSGSHDVLLSPKCMAVPGIIQHETLHLLGLYHEQSRPDRDDHVVIDYDNIPRKYWPQFMATSSSTTTTYDVPYDFESVMHYPKNAFATDPSKPTIRALVDGVPTEREMGQTVGPTEGDLFKIRKMYKCDQTAQ
ncbi:PREDICTED: zinc metalloproteinase nas-7 [Drosophila arizonae]|uniref:Metalloendopeptidase n=1 Tax=Drosophila arizonae TaxID=7263 RepID=A0ABM1PY50_DROAR|nr:PREDICTED: zinc metalloproteinase nas-7 [Drosophila arizonae]